MEIIRNYLDSMFAGLPNTPEVLRAKDELWQMMDDRYEDLIASGKSENEAIGEVISEFGNLEELAETLGLSQVMNQTSESMPQIHMIGIEEAQDYISASVRHTTTIGIAVMLFITSLVFPVMADGFEAAAEAMGEVIGISGMFLFIAIGVGLIIFSSSKFGKWNYIKKEFCGLERMTGEYVQNLKNEDGARRAALLTIGIMLCVLCVIPPVFFSALSRGSSMVENIGPALLFVMVGVGVMLIIWSDAVGGACKELLRANEKSRGLGARSGGREASGYHNVYHETLYADETVDGIYYENKTIRFVMSVFWPTITCIYLIWSFLTFQWHLSWIIWPIAAVFHEALKNTFGKR